MFSLIFPDVGVAKCPTAHPGLVLLCCNLQAAACRNATKFYHSVTQKLQQQPNIHTPSSVEDLTVYLSRNTFENCLVVVDKKEMEKLKDRPEKQAQYGVFLLKAKENISE